MSEEEINQRINNHVEEVREKYGHPVEYDPQNTLFTNKMRAFLNRASRRSTRVSIRQNACWHERRLSDQRVTDGSLRIGESRDNSRNRVIAGAQLQSIEQESQQAGEPSFTKLPPILEPQSQEFNAQMEMLALGTLEEQDDENVESTTVTDQFNTEQPPAVGEGDVTTERRAEINEEVNLGEEYETAGGENQGPEVRVEEDQEGEQQHLIIATSQNSLDAQIAAFNSTIERMQQINGRHVDGFENTADYDDWAFSLAREQSKFEFICEELVRQGEQMLDGLQRSHQNDPYIQTFDNVPGWIEVPDGGTLFTNARLEGSNPEMGESSAMGALRNREQDTTHQEGVLFQLEMMMQNEQQQTRHAEVGNSPHRFNMWEINHPQIEAAGDEEQKVAVEPHQELSLNSPGFRCAVNEEDIVSVFLKDTPSPESKDHSTDQVQSPGNERKRSRGKEQVLKMSCPRKGGQDKGEKLQKMKQNQKLRV
ncbi:hypothetical protein CCACVL1_03016 [Corchorus capsularis]|uniref:Uncharacterized protein n=1 Tax=Corchorus capsularis TaxID=210143 RepID=A0A1R3K3S4_COCAP|nr:hypothetical protein CCACVL1_03016 [Corchorus capsularis]